MYKKVSKFVDLIAWQKGHELVLDVYGLVKKFPIEERFCLSDQMRRAAISVTSNIAEGFRKKSKKEKIHFYNYSQTSLTELQNQLLIARDVGYISNKEFSEIANKTVVCQKMIAGLIKSAENFK